MCFLPFFSCFPFFFFHFVFVNARQCLLFISLYRMSSNSVILKFSAANIFSDLIHYRINLRGNSGLHFCPTIESNFDKINRFVVCSRRQLTQERAMRPKQIHRNCARIAVLMTLTRLFIDLTFNADIPWNGTNGNSVKFCFQLRLVRKLYLSELLIDTRY